MPKIKESETRQARLLRQRSPCGSPTIQMPCRIEGGNVVVDHLFAAEDERGDERGKDVGRWFDWSETLCPSGVAWQAQMQQRR